LLPLDRSALFLAKAGANLAFVLLVQALLLPLFALFFDLGLGARWLGLLLVVVLVDLGFVWIGTLFAAVAAQTRSRELILPILALPALVPVFIAAVELTSDLFVGEAVTTVAARGWFGLLALFDVLFGIIGALAFEFVLD
jgi:heme exporter protein B